MTFRNSTDLIPPGTFAAMLSAVSKYENEHGKRYAFKFTLLDRNHRGRTVTRTTAATLGQKSRLAETITSLNQGETLPPARFNELIGTRCVLLVAQMQNRQGEIFNVVDRIFYGAKLV